MPNEFVSILMLTHNAPDFTRISVESVRRLTTDVDYELVVVDNASDAETVALVEELHASGMIDKLVMSRENTLFAGGNNLAARHADPAASHFLLLNSDIEVHRSDWLRHLLDVHQSPGITANGVVAGRPLRVDGYCLLIDADLYTSRGGLDEDHQWWWSVTKLQAGILSDGMVVQGVYSHDDYLVHFGGKSGSSFSNAKGMDITRREVVGWFNGHKPDVLDRGDMIRHELARTPLRFVEKIMGRIRQGARAS